MSNLFQSGDFIYDTDKHEFSAEASTIGFLPSELIHLKSARTGSTKVCVLDHIERDADGDITAWVYKASSIGTPFLVFIFND